MDINIHYPATISNEKLYEICSVTPLSLRVTISRWKMFGHVLRLPDNSPASLALKFALDDMSPLKTRKGRPRFNLLSTLQNDISRIPVDRNHENPIRHNKLSLKSSNDIYILRDLAECKPEWIKLLNYVVRNTSDI